MCQAGLATKHLVNETDQLLIELLPLGSATEGGWRASDWDGPLHSRNTNLVGFCEL